MKVHNRYRSTFTGLVIAEIALLRFGKSNFEFDRLGMSNFFTQAGLANWVEFKNGCLRSLYKDKYCELFEITD